MSNNRCNIDFEEILCSFSKVTNHSLSYNPQKFTITKTSSLDGNEFKRVYFCSSPKLEGISFEGTTLMFVDILSPGSKEELPWQRAVPSLTSLQGCTLAEELLKERMRASFDGITSYSFSEGGTKQLILELGGSTVAFIPDTIHCQPPFKVQQISVENNFLQPQICPHKENLICFTNGEEICLLNTKCPNSINKLTSGHHKGFTAGFPTFIMQEEFDRYDGFWWQPNKGNDNQDGTYCILFEENDESNVPLRQLPILSADANVNSNSFYYPRPGETNSISDLKIIQFHYSENDQQIDNIKILTLSHSLIHLLPQFEYLVRAGWTPCGKYVWCQMLDREQTLSEIFLIPFHCFVVSSNEPEKQQQQPIQMIRLLTKNIDPQGWITVDDFIHLFNSIIVDKDQVHIELIYASEVSGHRHIVFSRKSWPISAESAIITTTATTTNDVNIIETHTETSVVVTHGNWEVTAPTVCVDEKRSLIYFTARIIHPLMDQIYVQNYREPLPEPQLLTPEVDFSYKLQCLNTELNSLLYTRSNLKSFGGIFLMDISYNENNLSSSFSPKNIQLCLSGIINSDISHSTLFPNFSPPELHEMTIPVTWLDKDDPHFERPVKLFGLLFTPNHDDNNDNDNQPTVFPCLHYIYGGPGVQMLTGDYPRNIYYLASLLNLHGFAVFLCDGPGSKYRGLFFEKAIKYNMGQIEIEYQWNFLKHVADKVQTIDLSRVAIHGWSYGGYMTLMAMAHFNDHYRLGIAGGSVTRWELYDTGYTERYMGVPDNHADAYDKGNVMNAAYELPSEMHRLMIIHGVQDENVHFLHASEFIDTLIKLDKPHDLLIYPQGRHRIQRRDHLNASMIVYLLENL